MSRWITHKYSDGSTIKTEWFEPMDGRWPYANDVNEVVILHKSKLND